MVNLIERKEVNELCRILSECGIIPLSAARKLLEKRHKTEKQINCIINQMVKDKDCYFDESKQYIRINKGINFNDTNKGMIKSLWVLIDLIDSIGDYFFQHKAPHTLTFHNTKNKTMNPFYDVFYVPFNSESLNVYQMNNGFNASDDIKAFVIIDDESQIKVIESNVKMNVLAYILVTADGETKYIERG